MKPFLQLVLPWPFTRLELWSLPYLLLKKEKGFFSLLLAFSLPRGEGGLTYGFQAWREAKGLDLTYDQISGQP